MILCQNVLRRGAHFGHGHIERFRTVTVTWHSVEGISYHFFMKRRPFCWLHSSFLCRNDLKCFHVLPVISLILRQYRKVIPNLSIYYITDIYIYMYCITYIYIYIYHCCIPNTSDTYHISHYIPTMIGPAGVSPRAARLSPRIALAPRDDGRRSSNQWNFGIQCTPIS